jgi:hypothetical protein
VLEGRAARRHRDWYAFSLAEERFLPKHHIALWPQMPNGKLTDVGIDDLPGPACILVADQRSVGELASNYLESVGRSRVVRKNGSHIAV